MSSSGESDEEVVFQKKPNAFNSLLDDDDDPSSEDDVKVKAKNSTKTIKESPTDDSDKAASKQKGKKKKGKAVKQESDDDEFDKLLADLNSLDKPEAKSESGVESKKDDDDKDGLNEEEGKDAQEVSSKTLKNKLKKEKKKQAKLQKKETQVEEQEVKADTQKKPLSQAAKMAAEVQKRLRELEEQARKEEEERKRIEEEQRRKEEEEERERLAQLEKERLRRKEKRERKKKEGKPVSAKEKVAAERSKLFLEQFGKTVSVEQQSEGVKKPAVTKKPKKLKSAQLEEDESTDSEDEPAVSSEQEDGMGSESDVDNWEELEEKEKKPKVQKQTVVKYKKENLMKSTKINIVLDVNQDDHDDVYDYRSPVCCVLGHVDTGKTKLLDKIRRSNVQNAEAGGITQQIGATFFPKEMLDSHCHKIDEDLCVKAPGLLIIDTPGHESFNNLRARGSSLCDIAILVVDIMHGLEPQTIESINLLKARKCYFVIALNKVDRIYNWKPNPWMTFRESLEKQPSESKSEFEDRTNQIMLELSEKGLNSKLYWENDNIKKNVSICPTSAITGEGISDLLYLLVQLTQLLMTKRLTFSQKLKCTVLEVKTIEGLGVTVDVILLDGVLREGDKIVLCGLSGPIVTNIRTLLTPQPLSELRVKGEYIKHTMIKAAMSVKIVANGLEDTVAGTELFVVGDADDVDELCNEVMSDMSSIFDCIDRTGVGVYVMASTLGSLEALLHFLNDKKIKIFGVNIGPVQKKDVKKASIMREKGHPEYSTILAFDIKVTPDAEKEAELLGVKLLTADIIYHLLDSFLAYMEAMQEAKKQEQIQNVVFPCELTIIPHCVFNKKNPFVFGVHVDAGILKPNTPLVAITKSNQIDIGVVASLEHNKKPVEDGKKGQEICIKVVGDPNIAFGRHFDHTAKIYSKITRDSIDTLKEYFREDVPMDGWKLVAHLKKVFNIF
ncbi:translation initiation factor IF-2 [Theileria orientalis strain Shintoku]|uniref:Eukaryotic translation initiation factor 5B n=1 Tax=Theileria orientalis strain Shintoku TaxID=869250 RepID=J4C7Z4_THEOR|nr:translation initiation factor IF-2 [Theileria orientalis strain Shintoku]BAM39893.1 translation initiation factor IF-2 [Theileria orientalis strain Shintoku]|eukprot:XP_009690194.1 translation initiation factor IF-2 [Theileria orientalis strain Shintoku]